MRLDDLEGILNITKEEKDEAIHTMITIDGSPDFYHVNPLALALVLMANRIKKLEAK